MSDTFNAAELQKKIGYGHGFVFGFTDDGIVWMSADSKDPEGRPIQFIYSWKPDQAMKISASIRQAAENAAKAAQLKIEGPDNVGSDSNRVN